MCTITQFKHAMSTFKVTFRYLLCLLMTNCFMSIVFKVMSNKELILKKISISRIF